jgi:hypothetical protein
MRRRAFIAGIGSAAAWPLVARAQGLAPLVVGVIASSGAAQNVKMQRLFSGEEVAAIRQKRTQLQASYRPPGSVRQPLGRQTSCPT